MRPWKKVWENVLEAQDEVGVGGDPDEAEPASKEADGASTPREAAVSKELEVLDLTKDTSSTGGRSTPVVGQSNPSGTALGGEPSGRSAAEWKAAFEESDAAAEAYKKGV